MICSRCHDTIDTKPAEVRCADRLWRLCYQCACAFMLFMNGRATDAVEGA